MSRVNLGTVITAMVTPFQKNLELDCRRAGELAQRLVAGGSDGIVVGGTTGESPALEDREKLRLFEVVREAVGGGARVIAGTGSNSTSASIRLTKQAEAIGVDAAMLVCPYYNKPPQDGLYQHFATIAAATDLPIMVYNVPGRTAVNLAASTAVRLAGLDNIVSIKEASGNLEQVAEICRDVPEGFAVYSGDDSMTLPIMAVGGRGVVSVASHLVGQAISAMCHDYLDGRVDQACRGHHRLLALFRALFLTTNPLPVKAALGLAGFPVGGCRLPLGEVGQPELAAIRTALAGLDLLAAG